MNKKRKLIIPGFIIGALLICSVAFSEDGTFDATVTTDSGSYSVPVEVEGGEVTYVHWSNGGDMTVSGAEISGGEASGTNSRGETVSVQIDDYDEDQSQDEDGASEE